MGGTGYEDYEPPAEGTTGRTVQNLGLAALSVPLLAYAPAAAMPAIGAAFGGLSGASNLDPKETLIGAGLGAAGGALPAGVAAGTRALVPRMAARPALTRMVGSGLGAVGGGALGAVGGRESEHPGLGALGGAAGGAYLGYKLGGGLASAAEEAIAARNAPRVAQEKLGQESADVIKRDAMTARRQAIEARRNVPAPYEPYTASPRLKGMMGTAPGKAIVPSGPSYAEGTSPAARASLRERMENVMLPGAVEETPIAVPFKPSPRLKAQMGGVSGSRPQGIPQGPSYAPIGRPVRGITAGTESEEGAALGIAPEARLGRRVILPGERIDPLARASAGSAAQAPTERLLQLYEKGDMAARDELVRRRVLIGNRINYSRAPLPRGNE